MILWRFLSSGGKLFLSSTAILLTAACLAPFTAPMAELIHIPVGEQAPELRDLPRPVRGMAQDTVLAKFGEPLTLSASVGIPPISKWVYEKFTVYFESSTVIHSVLTHTPKHLPPSPNN